MANGLFPEDLSYGAVRLHVLDCCEQSYILLPLAGNAAPSVMLMLRDMCLVLKLELMFHSLFS